MPGLMDLWRLCRFGSGSVRDNPWKLSKKTLGLLWLTGLSLSPKHHPRESTQQGPFRWSLAPKCHPMSRVRL